MYGEKVNESITKEIKEIESYIYDVSIAKFAEKDIKRLKKLYKKLGHCLSIEDQKEVINNRIDNMYDQTGEISSPFIYCHFFDQEVQ